MILVTAPTSTIGAQVLATLAARGAPVRAIARNPAKVPSSGIEVVEGSHGDATAIDKALIGVDTVFWLAPPNPRAVRLAEGYREFAAPAIAAFARRGVARVVGISALGRGLNLNAGYVTASFEMDDQISASGVAYRALAMPSFMENLLRQVELIRTAGRFVSSIRPDLALPIVATRDIAAVASRYLLERFTGVADVPVLGPEDLSHDDLAKIMSEVLGKPIRYQQVPLAALKQQMLDRGASEAMAQGRVDMMDAKDHGLDNAVARTPETATPTTFRQWCEEVLRPAVNA